ncbi:hypothetical protein H0H81_003620 [Sphagnurus paluster]|uniref:Uncharacterized protein n=1 Tax=Sphagnurus paluster TaxID=117069 RepID=A0A9P7GNZ8_9AGAR|nr:hypothetical protein H0H81_003620 [Sphagnurus paluster]
MFSKAFAVAALALTFTAQAYAHATVSPVLGVNGAPKRSDAQRIRGAPCGNTNVAANIDKAASVNAAADGSFTVTATNFNRGRDGSRQFTMSVDANGSGKFVAGKVTKNGVLAPTSNASEQITAVLPAGTKCTAGAGKNACVVSFKSAGNFGNCVIVKQGGAARRDEAIAAGTRAARAARRAEEVEAAVEVEDDLEDDLEEDDHEEDDFEDDHEEGDAEVIVKRSNILSWIWA